MLQTKTIGAMLAVAAASLFVSGCATQQTAGGTATASSAATAGGAGPSGCATRAEGHGNLGVARR